MNPFIRNPYNYDPDQASTDSGLACTLEEGMTQQQFAEEVDINTIVNRFGLTGQLPDQLQMPQSGDFTTVVDYHTAMNIMRQADEQFMTLPADLRKSFAHDPQNLMDFLEDGANRAEALKLGLINHPPEKTRDMITAIDDLAAKITPKAPT